MIVSCCMDPKILTQIIVCVHDVKLWSTVLLILIRCG